MQEELREQLETQAERLKELERYKDLCELRLKELYPGHPLPMREEYLGRSPSSQSQEVHMLRQKIARLEHQIFRNQIPLYESQEELAKMQDLEREKSALEESLRKEVLLSEEQRSYIEVLKQALETRMGDLGIAASVDEFARFTQAKEQADEARREYSKVHHIISAQESQIQELSSDLAEKYKQNQELAQGKDQAERDWQNTAQALSQAREDTQQLEEEKANLIEYINIAEQNASSLKSQLDLYIDKYETVSKNREDLQTEFEIQREKFLQLQAHFKSTSEEKSKTEGILRDLRESFVHIKERLEAKETAYTETKSKYELETEKNEDLSRKNSKLSEEVKDRDEQIYDLKTQVGRLTQEKSDLGVRIEILDSQVSILQGEKQAFASKLSSTFEELSQTHHKVTEVMTDLDKANSSNRLKDIELTQLRHDLEDSQNRENLLKNENRDLDEKLKENRAAAERQAQDNRNLSEEINRMRLTFEKDKQNYEENALKLDKLLGMEQENSKSLNQQILTLKEDIFNSNAKLNSANYELQTMSNTLENSKQQLRTLEISKENLAIENERIRSSLEAVRFLESQCNRIIQAVHKGKAVLQDPVISNRFKDINPENYSSYIEAANDEIFMLVSKIHELSDQLDTKNKDLSSLQHEYSSYNREISGLRAREKQLSQQVETNEFELRNSREDYARKNEHLVAEVSKNRQEICMLQDTITNLHQDIYNLNKKNQELQQFAGGHTSSMPRPEEREVVLRKEKQEWNTKTLLNSRSLGRHKLELDLSWNKSELTGLDRKKKEVIYEKRHISDLIKGELDKLEDQASGFAMRVSRLETEIRNTSVNSSTFKFDSPYSPQPISDFRRLKF